MNTTDMNSTNMNTTDMNHHPHMNSTDMNSTDQKQPGPAEGAAAVIASLLKTHAGLDLPVRLRAWDGSEADPQTPQGSQSPQESQESHEAPVVVIRSSQALR